MTDAPNYRMPMPPKQTQDRGNAGGAGYHRGATTRAGVHTQPMLKTGGMSLQPGPTNSPTLPREQSGFAADEIISEHEPDAQSEQTTADPVAHETEPTEVIPTTATAPDGGKTKPTVEDVENEPTGSVEEARYPALIEEAHPVGFSGKVARR